MKHNTISSYRKCCIIILLAYSSCLLLSCKKMLELPLSPVLVERDKIFTDDRSATAALLGLYTQSSTAMHTTNGGLSVYLGLYADDLYNTSSSATYDPFYQNSLQVNNSVVNTNFWRYGYANLYHANALIEGLEKANMLTPAVKRQLMGEAKFMRAWFYVHLVTLFGDVPLVLSTDYVANAVLPRSPAANVWQQIVTDLEFAKDSLTAAYSTAGKLRPNKWAAIALLARTQLLLGNWQQAYDLSTSIITSGAYQLNTDLNNSFAANNSEAVWQLVRDNANTAEAATFIPASATVRPALALTDSLINLFENGDKRKTNWTRANTVAAVTYYYPFKYRQRTNTPLSEQKQPLRLAEQYLIRAEAAIQLNRLDTALADLNKIRNRAGLLPLAMGNASQLMEAVEKERRLEFFAEDAHRWLDLKRWNKALSVLSNTKPSFTSKALFFPIPLIELERNPFLLQNPGY